MPPQSRATEQAKMKACDHCSEQQQRSTNGQTGNEELINKLKSLKISVIPCIWNKCLHSSSSTYVINMCVKFKAKQPWSGPFDKDRQRTTEETWKIIVSLRSRCKLHDPTHFPHFCNVFSLISRYFCSCVLFLLFFFVGHSSFLQNWLAMDLQGVTNSLATSGKPGTACDFAFAANMLFQLKVVCSGGGSSFLPYFAAMHPPL